VLTGAALGSLGGPIGTIIGGIAGAVSGWWAGKAISEAASHVTTEDEDYYRTHYESSSTKLGDRSYEDVRPAYQIGHLAGRNPDYSSRSFQDVEPDLRRGWNDDVSSKHGQWDQVRPYAQHAYDRGRAGFGTGAVAGAAAGAAAGASSLGHQAANKIDDMKDRIDGNPASRPGLDATDRPGYAAGGTAGTMGTTGTMGTSGAGLGSSGMSGGTYGSDSLRSGQAGVDDRLANAGHRAANAIDDVKDRIDGNPASRPGPDATDRPGYGTAGTVGGAVGGTTAGTMGSTAGRMEAGAANLGHRAANAVDDVKDRIDGNPASRPGPDATDRPGYGAGGTLGTSGMGTADRTVDRTRAAGETLGDKAENAWDRTKQGVENLGHRAADAIDDTKDRVDGNPASRPGPDATDRRP